MVKQLCQGLGLVMESVSFTHGITVNVSDSLPHEPSLLAVDTQSAYSRRGNAGVALELLREMALIEET